tara:strand:- start:1144 stop:1479 length:336 start_codon:yes stop_codon:yes gene_type:complete
MIFQATLNIVIIGVILTILLLVARNLSFRFTIKNDKSMMKNIKLLSFMLPRGLAAAAVSQLPRTFGIDWPFMQSLVVSVIIFSVLFAAVGSYFYGRNEDIGKETVETKSTN